MPVWRFSKTLNRITINGQTYNSVEEMPPDIRGQYEAAMGKLADRNANGVPDIFEQPPSDPSHTNIMVSSSSHKFVVNDQTYDRLEDIPPQLRSQIIDAIPESFQAEPTTGRTLNYQRQFEAEPAPRGGVTLHLTWPTIILLAAIVSAALAWLLTR
jgi:UTP-glucose-1-phosphate uridylyltransferase